MGLDLVVEGCARPGHEAEWRRILERSFGEGEPAEGDEQRFAEISIPPYERLGAPRVGHDEAADAWFLEMSGAATPEEAARRLKEAHGYSVLRLVESDGVPEYSHGGLYEGVDETSFRGDFLRDCGRIIPGPILEAAWAHKFPEEAVAYGRSLLAATDAADPAAAARSPPPPRRGLFSFLRRPSREPQPLPFDEQRKIVRAAGRWFLFWGGARPRHPCMVLISVGSARR